MKFRFLILILLTFAIAIGGYARGTEDETFGDKVKKLFVGPSPTPHKKRKASKKKTTPTPSPSPSASPSVTPAASATASPNVTASPSPSATTSSSPTATAAPPTATPPPPAQTPLPVSSPTPYPAQSPRSRPHAPLIEPVRPINPGPHRRKHIETPPPGVTIPSPAEQTPPPPGVTTPSPTEQTPSPPAQTPSPVQKSSPTPSLEQSPTPKPSVSPTATPKPKPKPGAPATISASEITGYENYPTNVRKLLDLSLGLTTQNLGYKYGSADPKNGGMDCSGFIHYVLTQNGMKDAPRDAREQYIWVRRAGNFQAVLAHRDDSFELEALKPGDLLFWSSTYFVDRDPAITHTMIYLGREKGTNQRIMAGASDGRPYKGQQRFGVSVFDFKISPSKAKAKSDDRPTPVFVGYGRIPGFKEE